MKNILKTLLRLSNRRSDDLKLTQDFCVELIKSILLLVEPPPPKKLIYNDQEIPIVSYVFIEFMNVRKMLSFNVEMALLVKKNVINFAK